MQFDLPDIANRRIGAKCCGTIVPVETPKDGESTITFQCNGCAEVFGTLNGALARAFALELIDDLVISRMDEKDPAAKVLTVFRRSAVLSNAILVRGSSILNRPSVSQSSAHTFAMNCYRRGGPRPRADHALEFLNGVYAPKIASGEVPLRDSPLDWT